MCNCISCFSFCPINHRGNAFGNMLFCIWHVDMLLQLIWLYLAYAIPFQWIIYTLFDKPYAIFKSLSDAFFHARLKIFKSEHKIIIIWMHFRVNLFSLISLIVSKWKNRYVYSHYYVTVETCEFQVFHSQYIVYWISNGKVSLWPRNL